MNPVMIYIEYAVPYWWDYGLFETVPIGIGKVWDGTYSCICNPRQYTDLEFPVPPYDYPVPLWQ